MTDESGQGREILLDNKKLLSIFFVVVVLMGVVFTIGFILGRNTGSVSAASSTVNAGATDSPPVRSLPPDATASAPATSPPPSAGTTSPSSQVSASFAPGQSQGTQPAKPYAERAPQDSPHARDEAESPATDAPAGAAPAPQSGAAAPQSGSYLQVAALRRQDADHLVDVLQKRGYPARLGESPKEGLFRVLVGPFHDMASLADSKQRLKASGFDNTIIAK